MEDSSSEVSEPLSPDEVSSLLAGSGLTWWIAGGWAIDLYLGHQTRPHDDIDVGLLRREQHEATSVPSGWELWAADLPGTLRRWESGERLTFGIHDIWCRPPGGPWSPQLMLNESDGERWVGRRDRAVVVPLVDALCGANSSTPLLAPEIQILYKAKNHRPRDDQDFDAVLPVLSESRLGWLRRELQRAEPGNPWLAEMAAL